MNRIIHLATALLGISLMGSCVSFKIQPPPEPENQLDTIVLCERVEQKEGLLFPGESFVAFRPGHGPIHCFVRLKNVNQTIRLKWKWYAPEGRLYKETKEVTVNGNSIFLEVVTAYDQIELKPDELDEGWWTVVVMVNGKLIGRRTFQLASN